MKTDDTRKVLLELVENPGEVKKMPIITSKGYFSLSKEMRHEFNSLTACYSATETTDVVQDAKQILGATAAFLENHDNSPLHVFMALHHLLELFIFEDPIQEELEETRKTALAHIRTLHYLLESANDESVHRTWKGQEGDKNFREVILRGRENSALFELTALHCLSHMSDKTYETLMSNVKKVSRTDRIKLVELNLAVPPKSEQTIVADDIRSSLAALIAIEIHRIAAKHTNTNTTFNAEAHAKKNFNFILAQNALRKNYIDFLEENPPLSNASVAEETKNSEGDSAVSDDAVVVLKDTAPEAEVNRSQSVTLAGVMLHQPVMLGDYWNIFLANVATTNVDLVTLMTSALLEVGELLPLQQWFEVLEEYCLDEKNALSSQDRWDAAYDQYKALYQLLDDKVDGFAEIYQDNFNKINRCHEEFLSPSVTSIYINGYSNLMFLRPLDEGGRFLSINNTNK